MKIYKNSLEIEYKSFKLLDKPCEKYIQDCRLGVPCYATSEVMIEKNTYLIIDLKVPMKQN